MKEIEAFMAVAQHASFTEAGHELHLTQPTITKRITQLEIKLKNKLFTRSGNQISLTDAGHALFPFAQTILQSWQDAQHRMQDFHHDVLGKLQLSCNYHSSQFTLPALLKIFRTSYPKADVQITLDHSTNVIDTIEHNYAELGIISLTDTLPKRISHTIIESHNAVLAIAQNHPLLNSGLSLSALLSSIPVISPEQGSQYHTHLTRIMKLNKIKPKEVIHINMLETTKSLVEAGIGWSLLYENMLNNKLIKIPLLDHPVFLHIACIYRNDRELSKPAKMFLKLIDTKEKIS